MSSPVIKVENLSKLYRLGEVGTGTISHDLNRWWARMRGKEDPFAKVAETNMRSKKGGSDYVWALEDINFEVKQGEALGIIGRNGAGKSTLLKVLSKVTKPTKGSISIKGRIASLLEVGTGFHPELTGRENIFLNGAILGMTKAEIRAKFDEIVDFAGVERYIDTPVKRYSSGMYVRLAFAVAAFLEPEILIVDEVLAVGDAEFQKKCIGRMDAVAHQEGRTILFVSHDLNAIEQLCNTALLMEYGKVRDYGNVSSIITTYLTNKRAVTQYKFDGDKVKPCFFRNILLTNTKGQPVNDFMYDEPIIMNFDIEVKDPRYQCNLFVSVLDHRKRKVFSCETSGVTTKMQLEIDPVTLVRGNYSIHAFIDVHRVERIDEAEDICNFTVIDNDSPMAKHHEYDYGVVFARHKWHKNEMPEIDG